MAIFGFKPVNLHKIKFSLIVQLPDLGKGSEMEGLWISLLRKQKAEVAISNVNIVAEFRCWNPGQNRAVVFGSMEVRHEFLDSINLAFQGTRAT